MKVFDAVRLAEKQLKIWVNPEEHCTWHVRTNKRAVRRYGMCCYSQRYIELSEKFVEANDEAEVLDVILHEIAHIRAPGDGHGAKWKQQCLIVGARPERLNRTAVSPTPWLLVTFKEGTIEVQSRRARKHDVTTSWMTKDPEGTFGHLYWLPKEKLGSPDAEKFLTRR